MLRIASAIVLAVVTLAALWAGLVPFAVLAAIVSALLIWEWGRLMRGTGLDASAVAAGATVLVALGFAVAGRPLAGLAVLTLGSLATAVAGRSRGGLREAVGVLYAGLPSLALVWFRADPQYGREAVLLLLLVVWATDTGAFVSGRSIGGPKLCAAISPKKTWAGLIGGVAAAAVVAWWFARGVGGADPFRLVSIAVALAVLSQVGDLVESSLKRAHGVKDTSALIPGHGGFMDRLDGLIFAAVAAALYALVAGPDVPGSALLAVR